MDIIKICILLSSFSFFFYCIYYFTSSKMKGEFKRFGLEKFGLVVILLQFLGAAGLLIGMKFPLILTLSSLGLSLLMFSGLIVRIKVKDNLLISLPATFYAVLNAYIFFESLN